MRPFQHLCPQCNRINRAAFKPFTGNSYTTDEEDSVPTLVTGATGLLGNNVLRLLSERGESVRVLVRQGSDPRPLADA